MSQKRPQFGAARTLWQRNLRICKEITVTVRYAVPRQFVELASITAPPMRSVIADR